MVYAACEVCDGQGRIYWPEDFPDDRNGYSDEACRNCQGSGWVPCEWAGFDRENYAAPQVQHVSEKGKDFSVNKEQRRAKTCP